MEGRKRDARLSHAAAVEHRLVRLRDGRVVVQDEDLAFEAAHGGRVDVSFGDDYLALAHAGALDPLERERDGRARDGVLDVHSLPLDRFYGCDDVGAQRVGAQEDVVPDADLAREDHARDWSVARGQQRL